MMKIISKYISYNRWANETLIKWLQTLDPQILYRETKSSFASIDLTLQHIKNAQNFWYTVITNQDITKLDKTITLHSFESVAYEILQVSQKMISTYNAFSDQELMTEVKSPVMTKSRFDFMIHVVNHNSYHRGQIVTIARLHGVVSPIPETDYDTFLWMEGENASA